MYTLYKSTNSDGKVFVAIEHNNKIVNMNSLYMHDYNKLGSTSFDRIILNDSITHIEGAFIQRDNAVKILQYNNCDVYNRHIDQSGKFGYTVLSKKYSFVYITSNKVNRKLYIGSHTTDNLNDGYIGSGRYLLDDVESIGKEYFVREIVQFYETIDDANELESQLIKEIGEGYHLYNATSSSSGGNYGEETNTKISETWKCRWVEYYDHLMETCHNPDTIAKRSESVRQFYIDNPDVASTRNAITNRDPEKIRKTAEKHTGMKRTEENKANMSDARNNLLQSSSPEEFARLTGKGLVTVTNIIDYTNRRASKDYILQENELFGRISYPKLPLKKSATITNILTWEERVAPAGYILQPTERKGNKKRVRKAINEGKMI